MVSLARFGSCLVHFLGIVGLVIIHIGIFSLAIVNINHINISGWWLTYPSEKYEFVSWDHYSQYDGKVIKTYKSHVPNHQPVIQSRYSMV